MGDGFVREERRHWGLKKEWEQRRWMWRAQPPRQRKQKQQTVSLKTHEPCGGPQGEGETRIGAPGGHLSWQPVFMESLSTSNLAQRTGHLTTNGTLRRVMGQETWAITQVRSVWTRVRAKEVSRRKWAYVWAHGASDIQLSIILGCLGGVSK